MLHSHWNRRVFKSEHLCFQALTDMELIQNCIASESNSCLSLLILQLSEIIIRLLLSSHTHTHTWLLWKIVAMYQNVKQNSLICPLLSRFLSKKTKYCRQKNILNSLTVHCVCVILLIIQWGSLFPWKPSLLHWLRFVTHSIHAWITHSLRIPSKASSLDPVCAQTCLHKLSRFH